MLSIFISLIFLFGFVLNIPRASAVACTQNEVCTISNNCQGITRCVNGQYGPCEDVNSCGGGGGAKCGDGVCNGTETSSNCPADCGGGGGGAKCDPASCNKGSDGKPVPCGQKSYCGYTCSFCASGVCYASSQPEKYICDKTCTDTDQYPNTLPNKIPEDRLYHINKFKKGTVTDRSGKKYTDKCADDKTLTEYYCQNLTYAIKGGFDGYVKNAPINCPNGCKNGVCLECKQNSDCANSTKGKFCDQEKGVCSKTCVPKTCKDYAGQCGAVMDNGCGWYINCIDNCIKEKVNKYCDGDTKTCVKPPPKNCCIGIYAPTSEQQKICQTIKNKKDCNGLKDDNGDFACLWQKIIGYPQRMECIPAVVGTIYNYEMGKSSLKCEKYLFLPLEGDPNAEQEEAIFFKDNNCRTERYWYRYHGSSADCQPLFGRVSKCISCNGKSCKVLGFEYTACSVAQNSEDMIAGARTIQQQLINKNYHETKVTVSANQVVSSYCAPTTMTINITADNPIKPVYFSCSEISKYNKEKIGGCAKASIITQARNEKVWCLGSDSKNKRAMCCPTDEDPGWAWFYVDADNPQCPDRGTSSAPFSILKDIASLLKSAGNVLSQTVVIVTSAISVAVVGIWWLISKFLLKK